jgi:inhibitor of KinA sporulation pathway (predicted exonuclease)
MAIRKDKIVVVDFEMTCWEGFDAPPGQENEIIEMGICLLDPKADVISISDKRSIMVKPIRSVVSEFCTNLTGITQEMVSERGIDFPLACHILETEYDTRNRLWVSWGNFDHEFLRKQCKARNVRYPFSKKHSNLKRVFHDTVGERMGLQRAMNAVGVAREGVMHRGDDDAYNTALLLKYLIEHYSLSILRKYGF